MRWRFVAITSVDALLAAVPSSSAVNGAWRRARHEVLARVPPVSTQWGRGACWRSIASQSSGEARQGWIRHGVAREAAVGESMPSGSPLTSRA